MIVILLLFILLIIIIIYKIKHKFILFDVTIRTLFGYIYELCIIRNIRKLLNLGVEPLASDKHIDNKWLTNVLRSNNIIDQYTIAKCESISQLDGGHSGEYSYRLFITYEGSNDTSTLPKTMVIKLPGDTFKAYITSTMFQFDREAEFYNSKLKYELEELVDIPRTYYAFASAYFSHFCILMEDIQPSTVCGHIFGNQCFPAKSVPNHAPNPLNTAIKHFQSMAKIHSKYWNNRQLLTIDESWLSNTGVFCGYDQHRYDLFINSMKGNLNTFKHGLKTLKNWKVLADKFNESNLLQLFDDSLKVSSYQQWQLNYGPNGNLPLTLIHGDCHANNFLFHHNNEKMYLVDWCITGAGEGIIEIAQYMISNIPVDMRRQHETTMLRAYYQTLIDNGVNSNDYSFEFMMERYKYGGLEKWLSLLTIMGAWGVKAGDQFPVDFLLYFHEQINTFVTDHHIKGTNCPRLTIYMPPIF